MSEGLLIVLGGIGMVVLVGIFWVLRRTSDHTLPTAITLDSSNIAELAGPEIARLLANGNKIQAIKRVRDLTGLGLKEAKDYVDQLVAGRGQRLPPPAQTVSVSTADRPVVEARVQSLLAQGNVIEAIRQVRLLTGMGLKEAKDYVDSFRVEDNSG